jgi:glutamine synthetase
VAVRRIEDDHFEFRAIDATVNMYLAIAAYCTAGILGSEMNEELVMKDCQAELWKMDAALRQDLGIEVPMPETVEEAFGALRKYDTGLEMILGHDVLALYHALQSGERIKVRSMSENESREFYLAEFEESSSALEFR